MHIKKSQSDQNQYRHITLDNNLDVVLVSDPKAEKSAAAIAVNAGANDNPKKQSGLTHFLEHMLFLGTQKYPDANEYRQYINQHGGSNNAYTASELTNYFFDIQPEGYEGALDRFSQFFIAPTFDEQYTQREKKAVHSEYMAKINDDSRRSNQAFKTLFNPNHPANHFSVGNLETLKDIPGYPLREQLIKTYNDFYYASNMTLTMVSNQPLDEIETLARTYFSDIKDKEKTNQDTVKAKVPLLLSHSARLQFTQPIKDIHIINLRFIIPSQTHNYQSKPAHYISYVLGQETKNSLYSYLKQHGWINSLSVGLGTEYDHQQSFAIRLNLTDQGLKAIDDVMNAVFFNIEQLKKQPVNPAYIEEEKTLSQLSFAYHGYIQPIELSKTLASQLHKYPTQDVLNAFQISQSTNAIEIQKILNEMHTDNMLIQVISKSGFPIHWATEEPFWQQEKWYNTSYANSHFSQLFLNNAKEPNAVAYIKPPIENPYIPEDLAFVDEFDETPKSIFQGKGIDFWHRADNRFNKPKSATYLSLSFNDAAANVRQSLLNKLWVRVANDNLSEDTYLPYNANLNYSLYDHINGITLATGGYTDKQQDYLLWLIEQILTREPDRERFELNKDKLTKDLKNTKHAQAYSVALWSLSNIAIEESHSIDSMINTIDSISFEELLCYREKAISHFSITGFSNGNKTHIRSHALAAELADIYESRLTNLPKKKLKHTKLKQQTKYRYNIKTTSKDKVVLYVLSGFSNSSSNSSTTEELFKQRSLFALLKQAIGTNFFTQLRTEKQLGYIVNTYSLTKVDVPALGFLVQSPDHETNKIIEEIEHFIADDLERITYLTDSEFDTIKQTILSQLKIKNKELGEDLHSFWKEITKGTEDFHRKEKTIQTLESLTKEEFIRFINQDIRSYKSPRIMISNQNNEDITGWKNITPFSETQIDSNNDC